MKRDMDLVREILLEIEKCEQGYAPSDLQIEGYSKEQVNFHVFLMGQAGLLRVADTSHSTSSSPSAIPIDLTWEGYDFLDAARSKTIWDTAKEKLLQAGIGLSIVLLKDALIHFAKSKLGIQ